jgi:hypothetical protein
MNVVGPRASRKVFPPAGERIIVKTRRQRLVGGQHGDHFAERRAPEPDMNSVGEPDTANVHVRVDWRAQRNSRPNLNAAAPFVDSTITR